MQNIKKFLYSRGLIGCLLIFMLIFAIISLYGCSNSDKEVAKKLTAENFMGGYRISASGSANEYLSIIVTEEHRANGTKIGEPDFYAIFSSEDEPVYAKGECQLTNDNHVVFYENKKISGYLFYSDGKYYYIENGQPPKEVNKLSDSAPVPESLQSDTL